MNTFDIDDIQQHILLTLNSAPIPDTRKLRYPDGGDLDAGTSQEFQLSIKGALDSLAAKEMVIYQTHNIENHVLTPEGESLANGGSYEYRVWEALGSGGLQMRELQNLLGQDGAKIGQGKAFRNKWIKKNAQGAFERAHVAEDQVIDQTRLDLISIVQTGSLSSDDSKSSGLADYRKRKLCEKRKYVYFSIAKGPKFSTVIERPETDLTVELLTSGRWKTASFKPYNFNAEGAPPNPGALHPLMKVREEFRNIFFEMGFTEMATDRYIESSFWCFDSLFVPQQHPARESQDTFYLKDPDACTDFPLEYYNKVKQIHESGGHGSIGYRARFEKSETAKLVLRTHTTSVSANMLYQIAQDCKKNNEDFKPSKLFSIDRVFRNEAVDATHLAEFHQVEGVVADKNITLGDLIGFMEVFFAKMGIHDIRVKPTYNPYTEPSMEIYSWHSGLKKWVEIGNSGLFRPEMLEPMGLPADVRVLGWGLSLERPTMIKYGISNIRDLLGHKVSLASIQKAAAVRF